MPCGWTDRTCYPWHVQDAACDQPCPPSPSTYIHTKQKDLVNTHTHTQHFEDLWGRRYVVLSGEILSKHTTIRCRCDTVRLYFLSVALGFIIQNRFPQPLPTRPTSIILCNTSFANIFIICVGGEFYYKIVDGRVALPSSFTGQRFHKSNLRF